MIDNYCKRYEFIFNPFNKNSNEVFIENSNYEELKLNLDYVIQSRGIGVVTGEPGCGKTSAIKHYMESLPKNLYKIIYLSLSTLTVREFLASLAEKFGVVNISKKYQLVGAIKESITQYSDQKKILPIIIVDEANSLSNAILNDIKMLLNFEMDSKNKAVLILVGNASLIWTLDMKMHVALSQRITSKALFKPLAEKEAMLYLETKIEKGGSNLNYFERNALQAIINSADGIPRLIDRIVDKTLMIADKTNINIIDLELVKRAINTI